MESKSNGGVQGAQAHLALNVRSVEQSIDFLSKDAGNRAR